MRVLVVWTVAVAVSAACASADRPAGPESPKESAEPAAAIATPTPVEEAKVAVVQLADLPHQRVDVAGGPDWLAAEHGRVFLKLDRGEVLELDEAGAVVATFGEPGEFCQGLGVGFGGVWTCGGDGVRRFEMATGELTHDIALAKAFEQGHLVAEHGHVWALAGTGAELVGIDPADGTPAARFELDVRGHDLASASDGLWVVSGPDDTVLKVSPQTGEVLMRVTGIDDPRAVAVARDIWIAAPSGLYRIDALRGDVLGAIGLPLGQQVAVAADPNDVWVRSAAGFLHRVDARTGELVERIEAGLPSGGGLLLTPDALWTTAYDDNVVVRLTRMR